MRGNSRSERQNAQLYHRPAPYRVAIPCEHA
nr:MAG TPA: hypothetical protein [Caudoviricetes sp.]